MRLNGMLAVPFELVNTSQEPEQLDFNNYTGGWNLISLKFKTHGMVSVSYYGVAKLLELRALKGGILPCEFLKCHTRILVTAVLAGNQKKENILGDSVTEREKQNDPTSIHKRETLIPSSLITERKDNAAIVWFCILKPLSCPFSLITVPQTIKLKRSDLKHFHLLSPDPLVLCFSEVKCMCLFWGLLYRAQRLR